MWAEGQVAQILKGCTVTVHGGQLLKILVACHAFNEDYRRSGTKFSVCAEGERG